MVDVYRNGKKSPVLHYRSVRLRLSFPGSIVVSITACHAVDPGSIPGRGVASAVPCNSESTAFSRCWEPATRALHPPPPMPQHHEPCLSDYRANIVSFYLCLTTALIFPLLKSLDPPLSTSKTPGFDSRRMHLLTCTLASLSLFNVSIPVQFALVSILAPLHKPD